MVLFAFQDCFKLDRYPCGVELQLATCLFDVDIWCTYQIFHAILKKNPPRTVAASPRDVQKNDQYIYLTNQIVLIHHSIIQIWNIQKHKPRTHQLLTCSSCGCVMWGVLHVMLHGKWRCFLLGLWLCFATWYRNIAGSSGADAYTGKINPTN